MGIAYYYETPSIDTRLESVRVLNPEWLTNGIYRLILRTPEDGFLSHATIKETLCASHAGDVHEEITYSPKETDYILHVMRLRHFELSHDIGDGVEMIPLKMNKTPPPRYDDFSKENTLHLRWEAEYLPNNLVHRLMIRKYAELSLNDEDKKCVWRTGGWFRSITDDCEALAEMSNGSLDVYAKGTHDARVYMHSFRTEILRILNDLGIQAEEFICCTVDGKEREMPYGDILQQFFDGMPKIHIPGTKKYISPYELLCANYERIEYEGRMINIEKIENAIVTDQNSGISTITYHAT